MHTKLISILDKSAYHIYNGLANLWLAGQMWLKMKNNFDLIATNNAVEASLNLFYNKNLKVLTFACE